MAIVKSLLLIVVFLGPAGSLVWLWWRDRLSRGVLVTIAVMVTAFVGLVAWTDMLWQATAERGWDQYGVYSPMGGAEQLEWWRHPQHDLEHFVLAATDAPPALSYHASAIVGVAWDRRIAWVLAWVIAGMTLWGLKHRKIRLPLLLFYIALVGFFLWAIGRPADIRIEAELGDDDASLLLMQQIGWSDLAPAELLPPPVWQLATDRWRQERGLDTDAPLDHASSLVLMTRPDPRPLRWQLTLPRTSDGFEHGRFLLQLTEAQGWYLYGLALAHHLRRDPVRATATADWQMFARLSGFSDEFLKQMSRVPQEGR